MTLEKTMLNYPNPRAGISLVEVMVTIFIASIAISGLVVAYTDGLRAWTKMSAKMVLYNEGSSSLELMERFVRRAFYVSTGTDVGQPGQSMNVKMYINNGLVMTEREAQFYFMPGELALRWNNLTGNTGIYYQKLIPIMDTHHQGLNDNPYLEVQSATFTPMDPLRPISPTVSGYKLIKIELVMSDEQGDTLTLTSLVSKRNKDQ